jgi:hypothetical protein
MATIGEKTLEFALTIFPNDDNMEIIRGYPNEWWPVNLPYGRFHDEMDNIGMRRTCVRPDEPCTRRTLYIQCSKRCIVKLHPYATSSGTISPGGYSYNFALIQEGYIDGSDVPWAYSGATLDSLNNTTASVSGTALVDIEREFDFVPDVLGETPVADTLIRRWGSYDGSASVSNTINDPNSTATATEQAVYSINRGGTTTATTATHTTTRTNTNGSSGTITYGPTTLQGPGEIVGGDWTLTKSVSVGAQSTASGTTAGGNLATAKCAVGRGVNEINVSVFVAVYDP